MTRHLSEDALLQVAETGESHPHADACDLCRRRVHDLREAISTSRQVPVPEPSPLFWDHLSARIREGVAASESGTSGSAGASAPRRFARRFAYAALALLLVAAGVWRIESARRGRQLTASATSIVGSPVAQDRVTPLGPTEPGTEDVSWDLVTDVAGTVDLETATEAAGMSLQPGAAERAALQLSPDEQRELVRLLQAAIEEPE